MGVACLTREATNASALSLPCPPREWTARDRTKARRAERDSRAAGDRLCDAQDATSPLATVSHNAVAMSAAIALQAPKLGSGDASPSPPGSSRLGATDGRSNGVERKDCISQLEATCRTNCEVSYNCVRTECADLAKTGYCSTNTANMTVTKCVMLSNKAYCSVTEQYTDCTVVVYGNV